MNKQEYMNLLQKEFTQWTPQECRAADTFIKKLVLTNFANTLKKIELPLHIQEYMTTTVKATFFSYDTEVLLDKMGCFPEWKRK